MIKWSVLAVALLGTTPAHSPNTHPIEAPGALRAVACRDNVTLRWTPVSRATGYRVYRADPDHRPHRPVSTAPSDITEIVVDYGAGGLQRFAVTAVDRAGRESAISPVARAMRFVRPWGIAVTKDGRRYLQDPAYGRHILLRADGHTVGPVGSVHYHFEGSYDIAIDGKGRILTAKWGDGYNLRPGFTVQNADLQLAYEHRDTEGDGPGQVKQPMGIAANPDGHIFVADTGNNRVEEFTGDGKFVQSIGVGELSTPMKPAFDRQGRLYVADSANNRIAVYAREPNGSYKLERSLTGGVKEPVYVLVDDSGRVFVSTNRNAAVYMLGPAGKLAWRCTGNPGEPIDAPRGLAFDGKGNLLVVDEALRRIVTVRLP